MMPKYIVTKNNVHIEDSYTVPKNQFDRVLGKIKTDNPDCEVWNRCWWSLKFEWATHNFLYMLHILRSHTKDVDLNYPQPWYINWAYNVIGCLVWVFVK